MNDYTKNLQRRRRLKYGSFAVALTAAVIALVVIINIVFSALSEKNLWYTDMTERDLYRPDSAAVTLLEEYRSADEDFKISFIFCTPEDKLASNQLVDMVHRLIKRYQKLFDFISIEYVDIVQNPQVLDKYMFTSVSTNIKETSIIVANGNNSILYTADSFFLRFTLSRFVESRLLIRLFTMYASSSEKYIRSFNSTYERGILPSL